MRVITRNRSYELDSVGSNSIQTLQFTEREEDNEDGFITVYDGTTNEEVLLVLIDRLTGINKLLPCRQNSLAITKLEEALMWLTNRKNERVLSLVE